MISISDLELEDDLERDLEDDLELDLEDDLDLEDFEVIDSRSETFYSTGYTVFHFN